MVGEDEVLELETRKRIYDVIRRNPGVHMRELERLTGYSVALVKYHLGHLEKTGYVTGMDEGGYRRFFPADKDLHLTVAQKRKLGVLRREIPLRIVLFLIRHPYSKHKDISENLHLAPSTVSFHMGRLTREGIVRDTVEPDKKGLVVDDPADLVRILVVYRPLFDKMADSFTDLWMEIYR
jgi:predicted transcriptional regulator